MFVLFDTGVVGYRILAAGLKLAQSLGVGVGVGLAVLVAARTPSEFEQRREAALAWLGGQASTAHALWLAALDALLEAVECPLIVVR